MNKMLFFTLYSNSFYLCNTWGFNSGTDEAPICVGYDPMLEATANVSACILPETYMYVD